MRLMRFNHAVYAQKHLNVPKNCRVGCLFSLGLALQLTLSHYITSFGCVLMLKQQVQRQLHPSLVPSSAHPPPTHISTLTPPLFLLMCNKQRLCTIFTQNILCLVSCRCTQNSCCSSPQHPIVRALNHISAPPKNRRRSSVLKHPPPPLLTQTSSRQQCPT